MYIVVKWVPEKSDFAQIKKTLFNINKIDNLKPVSYTALAASNWESKS